MPGSYGSRAYGGQPYGGQLPSGVAAILVGEGVLTASATVHAVLRAALLGEGFFSVVPPMFVPLPAPPALVVTASNVMVRR